MIIQHQHPTILVIGYGNPLCGDDNVGHCVAAEVARWQLDRVSALAVHQLTPELAATLADCDEVFFIDAAHDTKLSLRPLTPNTIEYATSHVYDPHRLLALAQILYARCPRAWWLMIPTADYALGAPLSRVAQEGIEDALYILRSLLDTDREMTPCTK